MKQNRTIWVIVCAGMGCCGPILPQINFGGLFNEENHYTYTDSFNNQESQAKPASPSAAPAILPVVVPVATSPSLEKSASGALLPPLKYGECPYCRSRKGRSANPCPFCWRSKNDE